jgi:hypothetical protein
LNITTDDYIYISPNSTSTPRSHHTISSLLKGIDNLDIDHMHMTVKADAPARHTHSHPPHIIDRSSSYHQPINNTTAVESTYNNINVILSPSRHHQKQQQQQQQQQQQEQS